MTRLKDKYISEVAPALQEKFKYSSPMQIPKVDKIVLNMGVGEVKDNPKALESAMRDMGIIAGQKPVATTATKSIAAFKLREGMKIGCKVTLRGDNMYYFLDDKIRGMDIIIVTTAGTDEEAFELLKLMGMPFRK